MAEQIKRINHKIGTTINWKCYYRESCDTPIVLTGYDIKAFVRFEPFTATTIKEYSIDSGDIIITNVTIGEFKILTSDTADINPGLYHMDIRYYDPSGNEVSTTTFEVYFETGVTR